MRQYRVGERVQSLDTPSTKGLVVRVRKKARTVIGVQWVDVLLDTDAPPSRWRDHQERQQLLEI